MRHEWEDDIKIILKEVRCDVVDWIHAVKDIIWWRAVVRKEMNLRII
jgi:hypothetical protein